MKAFGHDDEGDQQEPSTEAFLQALGAHLAGENGTYTCAQAGGETNGTSCSKGCEALVDIAAHGTTAGGQHHEGAGPSAHFADSSWFKWSINAKNNDKCN